MKKIINGLLGKQRKGVFLDGKVLVGGDDSRGVEILESWASYVVTDSETQAKDLFKNESVNVLHGNRNIVEISAKWASLTACVPANETEFGFYAYRLSEFGGLIVYSYENLFSVDDEYAMKEHFKRCRDVFGIRVEHHIKDNGKNYLVGRRMHLNLLTMLEFDDFQKLFVGPILDASITETKIRFKFRQVWQRPLKFIEKETPVWKNDFFFDEQESANSFFDDVAKPKFLGGAIEIPNHEQLAVLLASGAIDKEVTLKDGRIVILKGTERLSTKDKIKYDLEGNPTAKIEQQVRNTLVYGLDMTNGEFFELG